MSDIVSEIMFHWKSILQSLISQNIYMHRHLKTIGNKGLVMNFSHLMIKDNLDE